jgi:hypothetical protein
MQEQDGWGGERTRFAIEDLESVYLLRAVVSGGVMLDHASLL